MAYLSHLICGELTTGCRAQSMLDHLRKWIDSFHSRSVKFYSGPLSEDTIVLGPFCARVLLETSFTALVGRLDTFRILFLSEAQQNPGYEFGKRNKSAFAWQGDVIPDSKEPAALWSQDSDFSKISRALLSQYTDHLVWKPAINSMLDFVSTKSDEPEAADILAIDPETYIPSVRGRAAQVYSTTSKAVHWEFLSAAAVMDEPTVKASIRDILLITGQLGFVSHFATTSLANVGKDDAWTHYKKLREDVA